MRFIAAVNINYSQKYFNYKKIRNTNYIKIFFLVRNYNYFAAIVNNTKYFYTLIKIQINILADGGGYKVWYD